MQDELARFRFSQALQRTAGANSQLDPRVSSGASIRCEPLVRGSATACGRSLVFYDTEESHHPRIICVTRSNSSWELKSMTIWPRSRPRTRMSTGVPNRC